MTALLLLAACLQDPTVDAEVGFQGNVFPDSWSRVVATVAYEGEAMEAELQITVNSYSSEPVIYRRPLKLMRKARMRLGTDVYFTGQESAVAVDLVSNGKTLRHAFLPFRVLHEEMPRLLAVGTPPPVLTDAMSR